MCGGGALEMWALGIAGGEDRQRLKRRGRDLVEERHIERLVEVKELVEFRRHGGWFSPQSPARARGVTVSACGKHMGRVCVCR